MKVRLLAGIGMLLLAVGTLTIFFLTDGAMPDFLSPDEPSGTGFGVPTTAIPPDGGPVEVDKFLAEYNANYRRLWTIRESASWNAASNNTEANIAAEIAATNEMTKYFGSHQVIEQLRMIRGRLDLTDLQDRQIEKAWQLAAHNPASAAASTEKLHNTRNALEDSLNSFQYILKSEGQEPRTVTVPEMNELLLTTHNLNIRKAVWETGKSVGPKLKGGLDEARNLSNTTARNMGYTSYFELEAANYGMSSKDMILLMDEVVAGIMPLYQQLHCWVKYELAARYGVTDVPRSIPAHWLGNQWSEQWPGIVESMDMDAMFRDVQPQWIIEQAERYYTSMGFDPLPLTFWGRSDLFQLPEGADRIKKPGASAWHIDLDQDVRSLMSVESNFSWFKATHNGLAKVYYFLACSQEDVPPILRTGANRAFPEGIGTMAELACSQSPYMQQMGLLSPDEAPEEIRRLLTQALQGPVVSLPFTCGTLTHWEHDFYETDLARHQMNTRWWEYADRYQGIESPAPRGEDDFDPAPMTGLINNPARNYDDALSAVIMHQLHRYICREVLDQDVRLANYVGNKQVGMYLHSILQLGATRDWRVIMQQATGENLSSAALLEYYDPLMVWLQKQNEGRVVGF